MSITLLQEKDVQSALIFLNENINQYDLLYLPMDLKTFNASFFSNNQSYLTTTLIYKNKDQIIGLASASHRPHQDKAYITFLIIDINHQKKGIAEHLLNKLESILITDLAVKSIDIVFFNPVNIKWHIPFNQHIEHPNAPGIDIDSEAYKFFIKHGYNQFAIQNVYYRDLKDYKESKQTNQKLDKLLQNDIEIMFYDINKHHSFDSLFTALNSKTWEKEIKDAVQDKNLPVLVAVKHNLIVGFAGPLYVENNKRGYFAGIGIHPSYRGLGIGSVLFSKLCLNLKNIGSDYMTLFTGDTNPARNIYEHEGFSIVKTWANLRKKDE
jgi:ribosomal protein S18 acetylase RimI-like enzyme